MPIPKINADSGAIINAAKNQRSAFQNQARVPSATSPAAEIGEVAMISTRAPARTSMISR